MEAFLIVARKVINYNPRELPPFMHNDFLLVYYLFLTKMNPKRKGTPIALLRSIVENIFLSDAFFQFFLTHFSKIQRGYHGFAKFAALWRHKRASYVVTHDMLHEPITPGQKNVMTIHQNGNHYLFTLHDLVKIMNNSLCHVDHFFSEPKACRNPYNNIVFNKSTLYNIFFAIKGSAMIMPPSIQSYFQTGFDLALFRDESHYIIREFAIRSSVRNMRKNSLFFDIVEMLNIYHKNIKSKRLCIHRDFPREKLVEVFLPYFEIYFCALNTNLKERKHAKRSELLYKLNRFTAFNPNFGRKYKRRLESVVFPHETPVPLYNMCHIDFHEKHDTSLSHTGLIRYQQPQTCFHSMHHEDREYELGCDLLKNVTSERNSRYEEDEEEDEVFRENTIPNLSIFHRIDQTTLPGNDEDNRQIIYRTQTPNNFYETFIDSFQENENENENDSIS